MNRRGRPLFVGGWGEEGTEAFFVVDHGVLITERFGFGQQASLISESTSGSPAMNSSRGNDACLCDLDAPTDKNGARFHVTFPHFNA